MLSVSSTQRAQLARPAIRTCRNSRISRSTVAVKAMAGQPVLYTYPLAYSPFKAALILSEKGVKYTSQWTDLFNGQSLSPEFMAINPSGSVPVLVDGARKITDSSEIVDYVNSRQGEGPLGGTNADQRLASQWAEKVKQWDGNLFLAANTNPAAGKVIGKLQTFKIRYAEARAKEYPDLSEVYNRKINAMQAADANSNDRGAVAANEKVLVGLLDEAEQQLSKTQFLAGAAYSVADVMFTPVLFRLGMGGKTAYYLEPRPSVSGYYKRMKARPSFHDAFGAASSPFTLAKAVLPALLKAQLASFTGRY